MKKEQVPQDIGLAGQMSEVAYALNEQGRYELVQSYGWEPKTVTLKQAWNVIIEEIEAVAKDVKAGKISPLAYHMTRNQMNTRLLAKYAAISRWRVKRHLKPEVFRRLKPSVLEKYGRVFNMTPEQLLRIPDRTELPFLKNWKPDAD
jgi:hypothetical protein